MCIRDSNLFYPAKIVAVGEEGYDILFDDGDSLNGVAPSDLALASEILSLDGSTPAPSQTPRRQRKKKVAAKARAQEVRFALDSVPPEIFEEGEVEDARGDGTPGTEASDRETEPETAPSVASVLAAKMASVVAASKRGAARAHRFSTSQPGDDGLPTECLSAQKETLEVTGGVLKYSKGPWRVWRFDARSLIGHAAYVWYRRRRGRASEFPAPGADASESAEPQAPRRCEQAPQDPLHGQVGIRLSSPPGTPMLRFHRSLAAEKSLLHRAL